MIEGASLHAATNGLRQSLDQFKETAGKLAAEVLPAPERIAEQLVDLTVQEAAVNAGVDVVKAASETTGTLLDVVR
ncbi:hypothetical protein ABI59_21540 [Acidobacteria bacterium Mor1]|nr:hypothetical protein ABI59_21540 [Acidobacteria bacterium Mor1]